MFNSSNGSLHNQPYTINGCNGMNGRQINEMQNKLYFPLNCGNTFIYVFDKLQNNLSGYKVSLSKTIYATNFENNSQRYQIY